MNPPLFPPELQSLRTEEDVDRFLKTRDVPIVHGDAVTFLFRGKAKRVELRHWVYGLPSNMPMTKVNGVDLWCCVMDFPPGSRIEYKFEVFHDGHGDWILDPLNPKIAQDPFGGNSVVHCNGYIEPDWVRETPGVSSGHLETVSIKSRVFGETRDVDVYLPSSYRSYRRHRLIIAHDGSDYVKYSRLITVLDNLSDRLEIPPVVLALTNPGDRLTEYAADLRHGRHLVDELMPALESRYSLIPESAGRCLMGASFGGVASLATAWQFPGTFDSLLLQSGSFAFTDIGKHWRDDVFDPVVEFMNQFRKDPGSFAKRVFVSCGQYESLIYENRSLIPLLNRHGIETRFVEARDGHNWENWRDRLRDGLSWLFPGPLWYTYL